jgi:hypothetical protein
MIYSGVDDVKRLGRWSMCDIEELKKILILLMEYSGLNLYFRVITVLVNIFLGALFILTIEE